VWTAREGDQEKKKKTNQRTSFYLSGIDKEEGGGVVQRGHRMGQGDGMDFGIGEGGTVAERGG